MSVFEKKFEIARPRKFKLPKCWKKRTPPRRLCRYITVFDRIKKEKKTIAAQAIRGMRARSRFDFYCRRGGGPNGHVCLEKIVRIGIVLNMPNV